MEKSFTKIASLIASGHTSKARRWLQSNRNSKLCRKNPVEFAQLSRRCDAPLLGLRILQSHFFKRMTTVRSDVAEEYAACLTLVGAAREAAEILQRYCLSSEKHNLYIAHTAIAQWDYETAIEYLYRYLSQTNISKYQKLVAQANLLSALIATNHPRAKDCADELERDTIEPQFQRIRFYLNLKQAELFTQNENWAAAFKVLSNAYQLSEPNSMDRFLVRKWSCIVTLYAQPERLPLTLVELDDLKSEANWRNEWETARSLDFHRCLLTGELQLAKKIYFGTPFPAIKKKLLRRFPDLSRASCFVWTANRSANPTLVLNAAQGIERPSVRQGQLGHQFLLCLLRDFYRPQKMAELFAEIFSTEQFNVQTSPVRIRKLAERVRKGLTGSGIELRYSRGAYRLLLSENVGIRVNTGLKFETKWETLRNSPSLGESFSKGDLQRVLKVSPYKASRMLYEGFHEGTLVRIGSGPTTQYAWALKNAS